MSRVIRGCDQKLMACLGSEFRPPTLSTVPSQLQRDSLHSPVSARCLWCSRFAQLITLPRPLTALVFLFVTPIVCFRRAAPLGRSELPGAQRPGQDAGQHVRALRQLQRRQEGRLHREARGPALQWPGVRQLVASGRQEGVLRAAQGRAAPPAHLQGRLGGEHPVRQALRRHQEQPVRRLSLRCAATILLQGLPHRHV